MLRNVSLKPVFLLIALLCVHGTVSAQRMGIYAMDSATMLPIYFVTIENGEFILTSDENGFIDLSELSADKEMLTLRCFGYKPVSVNVSELNLNQLPSIYLQPKVFSMDEIVVEAKGNKSIFNPISNVDLKLRPFTNSQDILRLVPGLFIGQHAGGGKAEQIFLRGFDIDHGTDVNITVDGMPVNMVSHAHGQGYADLHFVIPEFIDRVDFNKGPYFADKGNFTTAGFVEFRTKNQLDNHFMKVEGGQFNTLRAVTGVNLLPQRSEKRNHSLFFAGEAFFSDNYFDSEQNFKRYNGMLKYHGNLHRSTKITATLSGFLSNWLASGQIPTRAVESGQIGFFGAIDDTEGGTTARYNANLELLTHLKGGATFKNQFFYSNYQFELYSNFTYFAADSINGDQIRQKESRDIFGYNSMYKKQHSLGRFKSHIMAGLQIRYDAIDDIELSRTKNRTTVLSNMKLGDVDELNVGAFYSQKLELSPKLDVTAAVRYDYFSNRYADQLTNLTANSNSEIFSPKLNFNYKLNQAVELYCLNGKGFHSNDSRVAVQQNGERVLPPAYGTDLGGVFKLGKKGLIQTAFWYLWLDQEFIYVGDEGVVEAGGRTRRFGYDLTVRYELVSGLFADVNVSLAKPRAIDAPEGMSYLPLAPQFTSIGGITYKKMSGFNGSLRYRYMADRAADESNQIQAEGYFVMDCALNYTAKRFEAGLSVQNILNTQWKETQFLTESRLAGEPAPVEEIHFTPGTPFFLRASFTLFF